MLENVLTLLLLLHPVQAGTAAPDPATTPQVSLEELYAQSVSAVESADWDAAIEGFTSILDRDSSHTPSRFYLAVSLNGRGQPDRAITVYREVLIQDATVYEARMNLGALLFDTGQIDAAVREFSTAMGLKPEDATPALYRAQVLDQSDRGEEAISAYQAVLDIADPDGDASAEAHHRLGALYLRSDRPDAARESLIEAVRLGIEDAGVFVSLGDLESDAESLEAALGYYEQAAALAPENSDIQLRMALLLLDSQQVDRAIPILESLPDTEAVLAESYFRAERYEEALPLYRTLTLASPDIADYWMGLGASYYETSDFDRAIPPLERTLALDPERVAAWGTLGAIYHQREDWVNAATMLANFLEIEPDHTNSRFLLAICFDNLGDYEQALLHYNLFLDLDDGSDDARSFQVQQRAQSLERVLVDN